VCVSEKNQNSVTRLKVLSLLQPRLREKGRSRRGRMAALVNVIVNELFPGVMNTPVHLIPSCLPHLITHTKWGVG